MGIIPHPPIFLSHIRVNDVWLLLAVGTLYEVGCRLFLLMSRMKSHSLRRKEAELSLLQMETDQKRKLGPQAFVETSKLERQVLARELELQKIYANRKTRVDQLEKQLLRYGNMQLSFLIFILYYGVTILTVESGEESLSVMGSRDEYAAAASFFKKMLFPISYVGLGNKISKWGMDPEIAQASIGALMVLWSAQVTVGKIMDAVDAYYL